MDTFNVVTEIGQHVFIKRSQTSDVSWTDAPRTEAPSSYATSSNTPTPDIPSPESDPFSRTFSRVMSFGSSVTSVFWGSLNILSPNVTLSEVSVNESFDIEGLRAVVIKILERYGYNAETRMMGDPHLRSQRPT